MSKVLSADKRPDLTLWETPVVRDDSATKAAQLSPKELAELEKQAKKNGFVTGHWEGLQAGREEIEAQTNQLRKILSAMTKPFELTENKVEEELVLLAATIAEKIVHRELSVDPALVSVAVQEAMGVLSATARHINLHLHPDDAALLHSHQNDDTPVDWQIVEDASLGRGECLIDSSDEYVDASVRSRIDAILEQSFGIDVAEIK
jgi:flagellar assembly protein FliH